MSIHRLATLLRRAPVVHAGVTVANITPLVSTTSHHGQSGAGLGAGWKFNLHYGDKSIDEDVAMSAAVYWSLTDDYRDGDQTSFGAKVDTWLNNNASAAAYAERVAFRAAFWDYLP